MRIKPQPIAGWGNYPTVNAPLASPRDATAWQTTSQDQPLVVRGLGRSYGDQAIDAESTVANTGRLNHLLSFDDNTGVLVCQAGVSLADIITTLAPRAWFPVVNPGTKYVTVGGAIANDIHGKGHHRDGSFARYVRSFTILLADGRTVEASHEAYPDLFWANFGGLGLLGVILTVTLQLERIETTYYEQKAIRVGGLDHMLEALQAYDQHYRYSVAWINPQAKHRRLGEGVLTVGNQAKLCDLPRRLRSQPLQLHSNPRLRVPFFLPNFSLNAATLTVLNQLIARMQHSSSPISHYDKFLFPLDFVHQWNRGYGRRGFVQYQFVVPTASVAAIRPILQAIATSDCLPFLNVLKKMGPATRTSASLSFPEEGFTLAIDFPVTRHLPELARTLNRMVLEAGGKVYLGKDALLDATTFRQMYPAYTDWLAVKAKYDPEDKFTSSLAKRLHLLATPND